MLQFPFFLEVSAHICKMVESSMEETLQKNENLIIGMALREIIPGTNFVEEHSVCVE